MTLIDLPQLEVLDILKIKYLMIFVKIKLFVVIDTMNDTLVSVHVAITYFLSIPF